MTTEAAKAEIKEDLIELMASRRHMMEDILRENEELRLRLEEAEETLRAISTGQVDAFVVAHSDRDEVFTLETADRPYRLFVEAMQQGAATIYEDGTILFCNDFLAKLLATPGERLTGTVLRDYVVEEDQADFDSTFLDGRGELRLRLGDSETVPVSLTVREIPEATEFKTYCVLVSDLTQQRLYEELQRTEDALRETEERFRMLADNMDQLAWICHTLGDVLWSNQRWLSYSGVNMEELKGWGWKRMLHPDHVDSVVAGMEKSRDTGQPWEDTFPLLGKDGNYRWFLSRAVPIRNEARKTVRWFGTNTDITEQLQIQAKLRRSAAELTDANRRQTEFLAVLGHELRNPLAPIRAGLEALRTLKDDPERIEEVRGTMERQTIQMTRLIDDLLDVSRITQGKLTLQTSRVAIGEVIRSAVEETRSLIEDGGQELLITLPAQPIYLDADPNRLAQILSNLLNNSAKYTPKGGSIWLSVREEEGYALITVRDDGIGIPAEAQDVIFEMFSQIDRPLEKGYRGLGIGLTLVKRFVEMHGGTIEVKSAGSGTGSEFCLRLPLPKDARKADAIGAADVAAPARSSASGRACRVLIVDDNTAAADMLSLVVQMLGAEVRTAYDGEEAVKLASEFRPELVLMDIGMPKMDGYEAARRIRKEPWGENMKLIALTGWGQEEDKLRTASAGFDQHLVKPAEPSTVRALIAACSN